MTQYLHINLALSPLQYYWQQHPDYTVGQVLYDIEQTAGKPLLQLTSEDVANAVLDLKKATVPPHKRDAQPNPGPDFTKLFDFNGTFDVEELAAKIQPVIENFFRNLFGGRG